MKISSLMALLKMTEQGLELYRNLVARFGNCINFPLLSLLRMFIKKILRAILFGFLVIWTDAIQSAEMFPDSHDKGMSIYVLFLFICKFLINDYSSFLIIHSLLAHGMFHIVLDLYNIE